MTDQDAVNNAREELMVQHEEHMQAIRQHIKECRAIIEMVDRIL
jgi:hypothetical protein